MGILHNKKGIELSINFIVMLILAVAVFAGGLMFAAKFFGQAEQIRGSLDAQTEKQIEKLLDSGSPVVIPLSTKEIFRNKFDTFGVGVLAKNNGVYEMIVQYSEAYKADKSPISANANDWLQVPLTKQTLKKNEKGKFLIGVSVPKTAEKGTYLFNVRVDYKGDLSAEPPIPALEPYDNPLQFIVKVP
ncbi:hypothetical protein JW898_02965 [Candidatus Woesearchaeota archaeon]|nr:hypothetical protein [Candidatus Woesearchaeota archaeon]